MKFGIFVLLDVQIDFDFHVHQKSKMAAMTMDYRDMGLSDLHEI